MDLNFAWEKIWTRFHVQREGETVLGVWATATVDFVMAAVIIATSLEPSTRLRTVPIVLPVFQGLWEERSKGLSVGRNGTLTILVDGDH